MGGSHHDDFDHFNMFVDDDSLVDPPLCGRSFT